MNADATSGPQSFMTPSDPMSTLLARNWWAIALRGLAALVFGLIALFVPGAVLLTLALFFAAYLLIDGVLGIVAAVMAASHHERWGLLLFEGLVNIVVGVIAAVFPAAAVLGFVLLVAVWALVTGVAVIAAAFRLHVSHGRWWLVFAGIVSVLWGLLLLIAPLMGAVVLTWWLGAYAIIFGIMLLVLGFRLRGQHTGANNRYSPSP
jgi:uncharacterized membrane protein HdeD (DUF308 family)